MALRIFASRSPTLDPNAIPERMALPISQKKKTNRRSQPGEAAATGAAGIGVTAYRRTGVGDNSIPRRYADTPKRRNEWFAVAALPPCGLLFGLFLDQGNSALSDVPQPENISHLVPPNRLA